jgi:VanZ family protein
MVPLFKYWLPVVLWMAMIFAGSTDVLSSGRTSRIIGPLLRWIYPGVSDRVINAVQSVVRKGSHVCEYALLSVLFWRARRKPRRADSRPWSRREGAVAVGLAGLYAVTDEIHQAFVPSRGASPWDVLLDTAGAAAGILARWYVGRRQKRW